MFDDLVTILRFININRMADRWMVSDHAQCLILQNNPKTIIHVSEKIRTLYFDLHKPSSAFRKGDLIIFANIFALLLIDTDTQAQKFVSSSST